MWIEIDKTIFEKSDFKGINYLYQILSWFPNGSIPRFIVFVDFSIDIHNTQTMLEAVKMPEFASYISAMRFFGYMAVLFILNTLFMGIYFVFFWHKFGATPGKMIMRMKIVDASDYSRPSIYRLCKRFCGYITIIIGIFNMLISKTGQATHDKIAHTVVIKS